MSPAAWTRLLVMSPAVSVRVLVTSPRPLAKLCPTNSAAEVSPSPTSLRKVGSSGAPAWALSTWPTAWLPAEASWFRASFRSERA